MRSAWEEKELLQIDQGLLSFSREDVRLLKAGGLARLKIRVQDLSVYRP